MIPSTNQACNWGSRANQFKVTYTRNLEVGGTILVAPPTGVLAIGSDTGGSATTGASGAPPAQVAGYLTWFIGSTAIKIPYYNV